MGWYVRRNGEEVGPVDESVLEGWIRGGMTDAEVRYKDWPEWRPVMGTLLAQHAPAAQKRGIGCGWWLVILLVGGCTIGACMAAPHIGWTGWILIFGLWSIANHLERQNQLLEEIRDRDQRDR